MHIQEHEPVLPSSESNPWRKLVTRRQLLSATGKGALADRGRWRSKWPCELLRRCD